MMDEEMKHKFSKMVLVLEITKTNWSSRDGNVKLSKNKNERGVFRLR